MVKLRNFKKKLKKKLSSFFNLKKRNFFRFYIVIIKKMAVSKSQKVEILNNLIEKVKNAKSIGFATTQRFSVDEFATLRKNLREVWATYTIAKKTLIKKAVKEALDIDLDLSALPGQIGMVCSNEDAIAWLGKVNDMVKETKKEEKIVWALSIFEWEVKDLEETKQIAWMPSRETLLWRLVWSMQSPLSSLARFFDAASKDLEEKWKSKVWELEWESKNEEKTEEKKEEVKKEEPKKDEAKEEKKETKQEKEIKEETKKTEEKKEESKKDETKEEKKETKQEKEVKEEVKKTEEKKEESK